MGNTLLTFVDKYYEYGGDLNVEDRGLAIGGYESAWLADLHQGGRKLGQIRSSLFEIILICFGTIYLVQSSFSCHIPFQT
jgi:hypothetical protein